MDMNKEFAAQWDEPAAAPSANAPAAQKPAVSVQLKQIVTIRLDVDMLEWFKAAGPGYQTRINQVLREHMDSNRSKPETAN